LACNGRFFEKSRFIGKIGNILYYHAACDDMLPCVSITSLLCVCSSNCKIATKKSIFKEKTMLRKSILLTLCLAAFAVIYVTSDANATEPRQAFGRQWGRSYNPQDWNRFYHYPYVYYPHNYYPREYFRSAPSLYNRYPAEMQVPAYYNPGWANFHTYPKRYHQGNHFILDVH
jgi:hypothetical protein